MYNVNTINLQQMLNRGSVFSVNMIEPTLTGESVTGYIGWLAQAGPVCALLTSDGGWRRFCASDQSGNDGDRSAAGELHAGQPMVRARWADNHFMEASSDKTRKLPIRGCG
jgi:hypothetical protein